MILFKRSLLALGFSADDRGEPEKIWVFRPYFDQYFLRKERG
jgi:hypothetical protein